MTLTWLGYFYANLPTKYQTRFSDMASALFFLIPDLLWGFELSTLNLSKGEQPPSAVGTAVSEGALEWIGIPFRL